MEKECRICGETKPASEFYKSAQTNDGLYSYCKPCQIAKVRRMKKERPQRFASPPGTKRCPGCRETKPIEEFGKNAEYHGGRDAYCRPCARARHKRFRDKDPEAYRERQRNWQRRNPDKVRDGGLKKTYGIPYGTYDKLFAAQGGKCAICGTAETGARRHLHVDHDHDSGIVRGLLCGRCNTGIGQLRHDQVILRSAIDYLSNYPALAE